MWEKINIYIMLVFEEDALTVKFLLFLYPAATRLIQPLLCESHKVRFGF